MYQRILVPIDGSHTSTLGLQAAIGMAIEQRARLRLISIVDEFVIAQNFEGLINVGDLIDALREAGEIAIRNALALVHKHDIQVESAVLETMGQRVSQIIVDDAGKWKADLIVMGTHGRRGFNRMVLGSDAEGVLRAAPVPVLMVRSPDPNELKK